MNSANVVAPAGTSEIQVRVIAGGHVTVGGVTSGTPTTQTVSVAEQEASVGLVTDNT